METDEAIAVCERWLAHLDEQRTRTAELQRAASLSRAGNRAEALRIKGRIDSMPRLFDGATLRPAVERLIREARRA